ncbi:MAG: DUF1460 domain-containing protein, partial [Caldithrix sp.]|nr:DUF1460 domain-containing protein [Caldithrix sp.]
LYSSYFLGTPYNLTCVGDGPYALYETMPLVNFRETNCMAFCEHVLALAISDSYEHFFNNLQHIRYENGLIGLKTRNHYTMADWLPQNQWLLNDVSRQIAGPLTKSFTRTISHINFFKNKGIVDLRFVKPDRRVTIDYIPTTKLEQVKGELDNGDIGALIFADKNDIFSAHMFMFIRTGNQLVVRESSSSKMTTFDTAFDDWVEQKMDQPRYAGISVMRMEKKLDKPFRVILPDDIPKLKLESE